MSGGSLSNNTAKVSGGAVYAESASFTMSSAAGSTPPTVQGNKATTGNGGAVYAGSGAVTVSAGAIGGAGSGQGNSAGQNGGALYAGSGAVTIGAVTMSGNSASDKGGALYAGSGTANLSSSTMTGNTAANGSALFINSGKATFSAGTYQNNISTEGGAVGMGSTDVRLTFSGNVKITDNKYGSGSSTQQSNVYLDQDSEDVLSMAGLGGSASIGIYVPNSLTSKRDVPGARFATYTSDANVDKIKNDRFGFSVQKDEAAKKLFWGMAISVEVRYLASFNPDFPPKELTPQDTYEEYYPEFSSAAISELAVELYNKYSFNPGSSTAVYALAFAEGATQYADYVTTLTWNSTDAKWQLLKRDNTTVDLGTNKIIIYYAEPAYISLENNTPMALNVTGMTVNGASVINVVPEASVEGVAGYGTVFAKNGAIRTALLPVTAEDLQLDEGQSVTLLIPGGWGMGYTVNGRFSVSESGSVRLRRTGVTEGSLSYDTSGVFDPFSGTTLSGAGTYHIIFGDDKVICKVRRVTTPSETISSDDYQSCVNGVIAKNEKEYLFTSINQALSFIKKYNAASKKGTVEMLVDYLLPVSDKVQLPRGFDITITTASTGVKRYVPVDPDEPRATISRDSLNTDSMIESYDNAVKNDGTVLQLKDLIIDGKAVIGSSDGGAVRTRYCNVFVDTVDFKNVYAGNGGALYVIFDANGVIVDGTQLDVKNSNFTGCNSTKASGSRLGGGAIHTSAQTLTLTDCTFDSCQASDQAGAVFHRVDGPYNSYTTISGCTFNNCRGKAAGGLELDSKTITVTNTSFTNCVATERNGGGFNVYALNTANPSADCSVTLEGCTFTNCQANNFGGGFRSNSVNTKVMNCTFTNTSSIGSYTANNNGNGAGGAIGITNTNAKKAEIYACTITGCIADGKNGYGGGIYYAGKDLTIGDTYTSSIDNTQKTGTMSITNCTAKQQGGGVFYNKGSGFVKITNATITGNSCTNTANSGNNARGGGVCALANTVTITGGSISNNTAVKEGGGIYSDAALELTITGTTISGNATTGSNGGGVYYAPATDTVPLTVNSCTMENNTAANGNGGGIWTSAGRVAIGKGDGYDNGTVIRSCTAKNGGGVYHDKGTTGSTLTLTDATVSACRATNGGGGGIRTIACNVTLTGATVSNNSATSDGGGIYDPKDGTDSLTLDNTQVTGNTSGTKGGGVYTLTHLYLKNNSMVTGNRLTGSTVDNAAGVYLQNNRTLYVGSEGATQADSSSVKENYTASGAASNLRLWWDSNQNHTNSVYVYCDLNGYIGVVNAAKVGTQFGTSAKANPSGFSDDSPVFKADTSTLHGIIDRKDAEGKKIIWAGPPVAKITDGEGNLLYLKRGTDGEGHTVGISPAIFDRLYDGEEGVANTVGAFNVLNSNNLGLDPGDAGFDSSKPMLYNADGTPYTGTEFCVKMLVANYTSNNLIYVKGVEGRTVTFTTAETTDALYPAESSRATVSAGSISKSFLSPRGNLKLEKIVIDGSNKVRVMWYEPKVKNSTVTLGQNAVIQNGKADNGAGVYIKKTDNTELAPTFEIKGGVIRSCTSTGGVGGGAIYLYSGTLNFTAGNITDCTAAGSGGGVFQNSGTFNMSGGTISGCTAKKGGGVLVPNNDNAPFNMSGGSIVNNTATETGGGIAVNGSKSRIYFSKKVTVSGNKATKNGSQVACNVELNQDSNAVINTNNGGLWGGSYIGVYVPDGANYYNKHGVERKPFGTFAEDDSTTNLYSFVNDRNGLKGGIIEKTDPDYLDNTIYWIKIFSLEVSKTVEAGRSTTVDPEEPFLFKVNIRGTPSVSGQLRPEQIDSSTGSYGDMWFTSNGSDTTTAVFALKDGESLTGVNLSEGLDYEIIEYLIVSGGGYDNQQIRYAALPMNGYSTETETLTYEDTTYTVIKANTYSSKIGENKDRTDVDPYTSAVPFTNLAPVCKITDSNGNLLYRRYIWNKTTNKTGEPLYYYVPAVYTELTGNSGAFKALEGTLYSSNSANPPSYSVSNDVQIQMLIAEYNQTESITLPSKVNGEVTLTTASSSDALFPKQDEGTTSTVKRSGFTDASLFTVGGKLTLGSIILDGAKAAHTATANGGLVNILSGGTLTIETGAILQNSRTSKNGGAVYVNDGGTLTMTGGTVNRNWSTGAGAGVYLAEGSKMYLSGSPYFGGTGLTIAGNIINPVDDPDGNWKDESLSGKLNGGKIYHVPRQDIFIAGFASTDETDTSADSLIITDDITSGDGTIWVWAAESPRYKTLRQFAKYEAGVTDTAASFAAFRNARPDSDTDNDTDAYLFGVPNGNDCVCWSGIEGSRRVILRKVDLNLKTYGETVTIKVHRSSPDGQVVETITNLNHENGILWAGDLTYGTYYLEETSHGKWFALIVDDPRFMTGDPYISPQSRSNSADAVRDASNENTAIRQRRAANPNP